MRGVSKRKKNFWLNELCYKALFLTTWPWFDFKVFELILLKNRSKDFFAFFLSAFSGGWGIMINHKSHSILSLNYAEGSLSSVQYWIKVLIVSQSLGFQNDHQMKGWKRALVYSSSVKPPRRKHWNKLCTFCVT